ncbi:AP-5 complex subunit mu-1-like [Antedon mediterranea]|uniref:AP-5 complex subunit mu-1-like n=1 Tax=Antedon mediterranea TaxID=105859 RepID=UPI003AF74234
MSIRAVWVVPLPGFSSEKVIFSRTFTTVERRAKVFDDEDYVHIPNEIEFYSALMDQLGLRQPQQQFVESRDSCSKEFQKPVFELKTKNGALWPVIVFEQNSLLFCCLSLVEQGCKLRPPLINIPGLSQGFSLLVNMADFLGPVPRDADKFSAQIQDLFVYMTQAAPFGTPINTNPATVRAVLLSKQIPQVPSQSRQPAWKPVLSKVKPQLQFTISEQIRAVQYDSNNVKDVWDVYGTVTCKAELEGMIPDVSMALSVPSDATPLDHLIVNPCVHQADAQIDGGIKFSGRRGSTAPLMRKIRFTPPLEMFTLCHYTSSSIPQLPIQAYYQMKGDQQSVKILIQLKLCSTVKNMFEYCEVQIPFFNRGLIQKVDAVQSIGSIITSSDKRRIGWNIGQKFPSRLLEVSLQATVEFGDVSEIQGANVFDDPFCVDLNSYAQIFFKILEYTHSRCDIDQRSVQVHPSAKVKLKTVREFFSSDYKVWNCHGDAQSAFMPTQLP